MLFVLVFLKIEMQIVVMFKKLLTAFPPSYVCINLSRYETNNSGIAVEKFNG